MTNVTDWFSSILSSVVAEGKCFHDKGSCLCYNTKYPVTRALNKNIQGVTLWSFKWYFKNNFRILIQFRKRRLGFDLKWNHIKITRTQIYLWYGLLTMMTPLRSWGKVTLLENISALNGLHLITLPKHWPIWVSRLLFKKSVLECILIRFISHSYRLQNTIKSLNFRTS